MKDWSAFFTNKLLVDSLFLLNSLFALQLGIYLWSARGLNCIEYVSYEYRNICTDERLEQRIKRFSDYTKLYFQ
jgi:hypothetical protein